MTKKFLVLGFAALFLASCSKDDDNSIDASKLTKKWYYESTKVAGVTIPYTDHEECGKDYVEFVAGGVMRDVDVWDCEEDVFLLGWSLSGNKLTVTDGTDVETATVKTLSNTKLVVSSKFDFDGDGTEETVYQNFTSQ